MEFRNAVESDANSIMGVINHAQAYFKERSINQWQDNYPNLDIVMNDIKNIEEICLDKGIHSIRIGTHEENISMKKLLQKNGFQYCS